MTPKPAAHVPANLPVTHLLPGECAVSRGETAFATILGSCVTACIYDKHRGIGGMNHFMLPQNGSLDPMQAAHDRSARYGDYAMELLINRAMAQGAERHNLVAKLFGGAAVLQIASTIGMRNIEFALRYLRIESIPVIASDLGGSCARKILFYPGDGHIELTRIRRPSQALTQRETSLIQKMDDADPAGEIIFF